VLVVFQWRLLDECGFRPQIEADVRTDEVLGDEMEYLFSPSLGGVLAPSDGAVAGTWRVRAETLELLRRAAEPAPDLSGATAAGLDRANRLLASYARHVLGSQPATMPVLFGDRLAR
jgi:recombinational DNA repair protein (RecF pathway)